MKNEKLNRIFGICIIAFIIILWAGYVLASVVVLPSADDFVNQSDVIATGNVKSITSFKTDDGIRTVIGIDVTERIKGTISDYIEVRELGGKVGDEISWISGSPEYKVGEKVTVLLKRQADGSLRTHLLDNGRIPNKPFNSAQSLIGTTPTFKDSVLSDIQSRRKELKSAPSKSLALGLMAQPAPLSGPAESSMEFRFMTDPPSRWLNNPVAVYGDPVGDVKYGPTESSRSVKDATTSWSSAGNVTFQYSGDTPAVGYTCVPDKLLVQFRDVKNDIEDPNQCSGVLAIGGFCGGAIINGKYKITGGAVVFNNGWEGCSFWNPDNITEVMTHEFGHAIGLSHSAESGQATTPLTQDATMYFSAHFDGRRDKIKDYDKGAIAALYGKPEPTPTVPSSTPTTPITTPTIIFTPEPTSTPTNTKTENNPFYELSSLIVKSVTGEYNEGYAIIQFITKNEKILNNKIQVIIFGKNKSQLILNFKNIQISNNKLSLRAVGLKPDIITEQTNIAVIVGNRIAFKTLKCIKKSDKYILIYNCE